ncbi:inorganic phosphate transporter [Haloarchaeobius sp. HME9146]|uniref:inorganic phosphate transporter n=1 Tax=Haloarchaeobius sp. HME9146 TaxID=2978732 RepID=UPI0021BF6192|nr:inorganic phosphate transporter [Haloarchaeobius sp. HME9146]MCT9094730.1 anion permease [Haloarchaeobius sp. HME9146]
MVGAATIATFLVAGLASLFMAWSIGAGSSGSTPFAPAVGANAISVMRAGFFVGILGFAGAVLQGQGVTDAVGKELVLFPAGGGLTALAATVGLLIAGLLVAAGIFTGYPIATAFTVTGAVVGVGLALGGQPAIDKYRVIVTMWVAVPFVGGGVAYVVARLLRAEGVSERLVVPLLAGIVGVIIANVKFVLLGPAGESQSIARTAAQSMPGSTLADMAIVSLALGGIAALALAQDMANDETAGQRHFLLVLGALVAFSAGGSQVGLAVGPLAPLLSEFSIPTVALLLGGGLGLLAGSWTGAPRMIKALSQDYSSLGPRRSIAALIPSFAIAQTAIFLGVPISFNEIIVSAIVGSGYAAGGSGVSRKKMVYTVLAWIGSLVLAFVVSYLGFLAVDAVL